MLGMPDDPQLPKQVHFWAQLAVNIVNAAIAAALIPPGIWSRLAAGVLILGGSYGYVRALAYSPPRQPWTAEDRAAAGLPPEPPIAPK